MSWRRRCLALGALAALLGALIVLAQPSPEPAKANVICDAAGAPVGAVSDAAEAVTGGLVGGGNPVDDACNAVTDGAVGAVTAPVGDAIEGIGSSIFDQVTSWVTDGAVWLIGEVVKEIEASTTPKLTSKGFIGQYAKMAEIAVYLAAAMLLLAIFEAIAQSSAGILFRAVFVNVPLAFVATSVAFVVVQLLLVATDAMSHAVAAASDDQGQRFFKSAIKGLGEAGGSTGEAVSGKGPVEKAQAGAGGAVALPLFVTFLAAIVGAFAAWCVWIELLMRDAAVYVVALFMPLALATSISPRWSGVLRRTCELLVVVIASKFVIVSIIALSVSLLSEDGAPIEHILAATALLLLACFAPFILFRLVLSVESAMGAAFGRRSASSTSVTGMRMANNAQRVGSMARSNWERSPEVWSVGGSSGGRAGGSGKAASGGSASAPSAGKGGSGGAGGGQSAGAGGGKAAGAGAVGPTAAAAGAAVGAAQAGKAAAGRLGSSGAASAATERGGKGGAQGAQSPVRGGQGGGAGAGAGRAGEHSAEPSRPAETPPRPPRESETKPRPKESK